MHIDKSLNASVIPNGRVMTYDRQVLRHILPNARDTLTVFSKRDTFTSISMALGTRRYKARGRERYRNDIPKVRRI